MKVLDKNQKDKLSDFLWTLSAGWIIGITLSPSSSAIWVVVEFVVAIVVLWLALRVAREKTR